jgi:hypothetical protein
MTEFGKNPPPELLGEENLPDEYARAAEKLAANALNTTAVYAATANAVQQFGSSPSVMKAYERLLQANARLETLDDHGGNLPAASDLPSFTGQEFASALESNETAFERKYSGNRIELRARLKGTGSSAGIGSFLQLETGRDSLMCIYGESDAARADSLRKGDLVRVAGVLERSMGGYLRLYSCEIRPSVVAPVGVSPTPSPTPRGFEEEPDYIKQLKDWDAKKK